MKFLTKIRINITLRRMRGEGGLTADEVKAVRKVMASKVMMTALQDKVKAKYQGAPAGAQGALGDGAILNWLWEHRQEILAFVMTIVEMFK